MLLLFHTSRQFSSTTLSSLSSPLTEKRGQNMMTKKPQQLWTEIRTGILLTITFMGKSDLAHGDLYNLLPITNRLKQWELRNGAHSSGSISSVLEQLVLALV